MLLLWFKIILFCIFFDRIFTETLFLCFIAFDANISTHNHHLHYTIYIVIIIATEVFLYQSFDGTDSIWCTCADSLIAYFAYEKVRFHRSEVIDQVIKQNKRAKIKINKQKKDGLRENRTWDLIVIRHLLSPFGHRLQLKYSPL